MLGMGRALLLQIAHPSVAAAVAQHSAFDVDPWGRLLRTLQVGVRITFGDSSTSAAAAEHLRGVHRSVRGRRPDGARYGAANPDLLVWVWATLVDSTLKAYTSYVGALTPAEVDAYYEEQQRFALACGVPAGHWPESYAAFRDYLDAMVTSGLEVIPQARRIADSVLIPPLPAPLAIPARPTLELLRLTTVGLLPPQLRAEYGCGWGPVREAALRASQLTARHTLRLVPEVLRQLPAPR